MSTDIITPEWQKPVIRVPLTQAFPQLSEIREFKNRVCLFNEDRTRCYDVVSPRYQLVEHSAGIQRLTDGLQRYFGKGKEIRTNVRTFNSGARLRAEIIVPTLKPLVVAKGDVSEIRIQARNSYDRSCVFRAELAAMRLICTNGSTTGEAFGSVRMKHINIDQSSEEAREEADADLMAAIDQMITGAPQMARKWKQWADEKVSLLTATEMIDGLFPRMYTDPILDEARWKTERTMWQFYNDLTYMSSHQAKSVQRRQTFEDKIAALFYLGEGALEGLDDDEGDEQ